MSEVNTEFRPPEITTPRKVLGKVYEAKSKGGFNGAILRAQEAAKKYAPKLKELGVQHTAPDIKDFDKPTAIFEMSEDQINKVKQQLNTDLTPVGLYDNQKYGDIYVSKKGRTPQEIKETKKHEIRHDVDKDVNNPKNMFANIFSKFAPLEDRNKSNAIMSPRELKPRLGEIKEKYLEHTGIEVTTPDEAKKAILWTIDNRDKLSNSTNLMLDMINENLFLNPNFDTLKIHDQMFYLMPGVVRRKENTLNKFARSSFMDTKMLNKITNLSPAYLAGIYLGRIKKADVTIKADLATAIKFANRILDEAVAAMTKKATSMSSVNRRLSNIVGNDFAAETPEEEQDAEIQNFVSQLPKLDAKNDILGVQTPLAQKVKPLTPKPVVNATPTNINPTIETSGT
jgi:hypothetical protein